MLRILSIFVGAINGIDNIGNINERLVWTQHNVQSVLTAPTTLALLVTATLIAHDIRPDSLQSLRNRRRVGSVGSIGIVTCESTPPNGLLLALEGGHVLRALRALDTPSALDALDALNALTDALNALDNGRVRNGYGIDVNQVMGRR